MAGGEETQEPKQESQEGENASREVKAQDEVKEQETQRNQEVVEEPAAVIERERDVKESEEIEQEVVKAVEAVGERGAGTEDRKEAADTAADGGPKTEDREEISATPIPLPGQPDKPGDEISATPIPLPGQPDKSGEEVSATPIPLPGQPDKSGEEISATPIPLPGQPDKSGEEISATPIPLPGQPDRPGEEISATPIPLPGQPDRPGEEISATPIPLPGQPDRPGEEISATPIPLPGQSREEQIIKTDDHMEELEPQEGKPVPAEDIEHQDHWSEPGSEVVEGLEEELPEVIAEEAEEIQEDEGGSILIGEDEEELEQIDLSAEAAKEVEEYWEPPEMYVHQNKDGSLDFVDAAGKPIKCPPHYSRDAVTGEVQAWYYGAKTGEVFDVPPFPGHDLTGILAYTAPDGTVSFVDSGGNLIDSPPDFLRNKDGSIFTMDADGKQYTFKTYEPPTKGVYIYYNQDGSYQIVDQEGDLINCPPTLVRDSVTKEWLIKTSEDQFLKIPEYKPPTQDIYYYQGADGSTTIVDEDGTPIKCPPIWSSQYAKTGGSDTNMYIKGEDGEYLTIQEYVPPTEGVFICYHPDDSITLVNDKGETIKSPPKLTYDHIDGEYYLEGKDGSRIKPQKWWQRPIDMYVYVGQDGSVEIVNENGEIIENPMQYTEDNGKYIALGGEEIPLYKPPSSHWDKK